MNEILKFKGRSIVLSTDEDVTDYSDIDFLLEDYDNKDVNGDPNYIYLSLKEHEAIYLANAILSYVEFNRKGNKRWEEETR